MRILKLIKKPLMSEKNAFQMESNTYVFEVVKAANKIEIRKAIEEAFQVKVAGVRTSIGRGKSKKTKFGETKVKYFKKAFVKLAEGQKIALFEGS